VYRSAFKNKSDMLVLDPTSEFFQYLKQSGSLRSAPRPPAK